MMFVKGIKYYAAVIIALLAVSFVIGAGNDQQDQIRFSHGYHMMEVEMDCADCHDGVESLPAGGRSIPNHEVCESCHDVEDDETCNLCHTDPGNPLPVPARAGLFEGFAHQVHTKVSVSCEKCHSSIKELAAEPVIPEMAECQHCHLSAPAKLDCGSCHLGMSPKPDDHKLVSWKMSDHGLEASFGTTECAACHEQQSCDECHQGINLYGSPHSPTWMFDHFTEVSWGRDCFTCHETRESCTSCHKTMVPVPHELGPRYASYPGGGEHAEEAKAFSETCLSCHDIGGDDPTCARCHQ